MEKGVHHSSNNPEIVTKWRITTSTVLSFSLCCHELVQIAKECQCRSQFVSLVPENSSNSIQTESLVTSEVDSQTLTCCGNNLLNTQFTGAISPQKSKCFCCCIYNEMLQLSDCICSELLRESASKRRFYIVRSWISIFINVTNNCAVTRAEIKNKLGQLRSQDKQEAPGKELMTHFTSQRLFSCYLVPSLQSIRQNQHSFQNYISDISGARLFFSKPNI